MQLRAPLRLLAIVATTPPLYAGWVLTRPLAWAVPRLDPLLQRAFIGTWAWAMLWIMGVRARFEGPRPTGSYFLVANHLSYVDIPLMLARLDARFLAKSEIAGWPVMGLLARTTGTLFIDRSRKRDLTRAIGEIRAVLARGTGVIVFPEGTSTDGAAVEPFKPSLFQVPVELGLPVQCAAIHYDSPGGPLPAWQGVCWWGDATFGPHFYQFLKQRRTVATVTFAAAEASFDADGTGRRKHLALAAHESVRSVFTPSRTPTGPSATTSS
ncbi:MAG: lysophospholipid acyltransferase family protein [Planctomycetota bacterium]